MLDDDVAEQTRLAAAASGRTFKEIVNEALRAWLDLQKRPARGKRYRTAPRALGLRPGMSLDNVQELIAAGEGEDAR